MKNHFKKKQTVGKLIVFGVLLESKMGGFKDILVLLGKEREAKKIDKEYQKRKFKGPWGLKQLANLYKGFSKEKLKELALDYCQQNLTKGAREITVGLKKKGFLIGAISSNPQFIMDALAEILSLDFSEGTQLEFKEGIATGKIKKKVDRYTKVEILREKKRNYGLAEENVIVIGDSITALPMVREAKIFINFDIQKENIQNIARYIIEDKNLRKIFGYFKP
ncbi:MAG: hypothetical protein COS98_02300 [Parcubacteria group bacterium CG07_land_8_20_14_0_80_35_11]|nr:MAG: hypothetical protein COS98_02300 [Parcubacteria group bacterium CG07_land_8_20_14_0_80_35_11]